MRKTCVAGAVALAIFCSSPSVAETPDSHPLPPEMLAAINDALADVEGKLFQPGPAQTGWNVGGPDLRSVVAGKPGGLAGNYLLSTDKRGELSVTIYTSAPVSQFLPQTWRRVTGVGNIDAGGSRNFLNFSQLEGPYRVVVRSAEKRVGDAYCESAMLGADLYVAPDADNSGVLPDAVARALFEGAVAMTSKYKVCEKYLESARGYGIRYYLEDGRSLPGMEESQELLTIVPASSVEDLLKPKAR